MSPAKWNVDNSGNVKGFVRRKGDLNPMSWGYHIDKSILDHPKIGLIKIDVSKPEDKEVKCKSCIKKEQKKAEKAKKDEEDSRSAGGCVVM